MIANYGWLPVERGLFSGRNNVLILKMRGWFWRDVVQEWLQMENSGESQSGLLGRYLFQSAQKENYSS